MLLFMINILLRTHFTLQAIIGKCCQWFLLKSYFLIHLKLPTERRTEINGTVWGVFKVLQSTSIKVTLLGVHSNNMCTFSHVFYWYTKWKRAKQKNINVLATGEEKVSLSLSFSAIWYSIKCPIMFFLPVCG